MTKTDYHKGQDDKDNGRGGSIELYSGERFHPLDPDPSMVNIDDIAHSLSLNCRYNGHTKGFYSVAEHSVLMSRHIINLCAGEDRPTQVDLAFQALLHDASETYLPDMPRPIKGLVDGFDEAEERLQQVIAEAFDMSFPIPGLVHKMDNIILADEARQLMTSGGEDWYLPEDGIGIEVFCWTPDFAKQQFLTRFYNLKTERKVLDE